MGLSAHLQGPGQHGLGNVPEPRTRLYLDGLQPQMVVVGVSEDDQKYVDEGEEKDYDKEEED